jgi:hypothetical protein
VNAADRDRFVARLPTVRDADTCWPFSGAPTRGGYRRIHIDGKLTKAHRASYRLFVGPIPEGMHVLHRCDNPPCVNPAHLFLGTNLDNIRDAAEKGHKTAHTAHFYADELEVIRQSGWAVRSLALRFGVSVRTIYRALRPEYQPRREHNRRKGERQAA